MILGYWKVSKSWDAKECDARWQHGECTSKGCGEASTGWTPETLPGIRSQGPCSTLSALNLGQQQTSGLCSWRKPDFIPSWTQPHLLTYIQWYWYLNTSLNQYHTDLNKIQQYSLYKRCTLDSKMHISSKWNYENRYIMQTATKRAAIGTLISENRLKYKNVTRNTGERSIRKK